MDTQQLIEDTATKIFTDHCDKALLDRCEQGEFADALWQQIVANGFHQLGDAASGTTPADTFAFLKVCGRHAVPLPMAEMLLGHSWAVGQLAPSEGLVSIGKRHGEQTIQVPWGRRAHRVFGVEADSLTITVSDTPACLQQGNNMAGEARDIVAVGADHQEISVTDDPFAQMALARTNVMAGTLQAVLDLGLQFAAEREQFGRSISKFQAIQHSLAVVAAEVAAAQRAADAGVDALGTDRFIVEVAASKARVGEAVGIVAEQVHQVHGAMGFTHEHRLHHFTRRLWAWRDEWGNEAHWQRVLGARLAALGADQVWGYIATRG
jgi:alkylation response protein AidB-like acyl-CoA dehydrogenase